MEYQEMLERAKSELPDEIGEENLRMSIPEPEVRVEGNWTVYENFTDAIDMMNRDRQLVKTFFKDELATSAEVDSDGNVRFKGDFGQERFENILKEFIEVFVECSECSSRDTHITDENGVDMMKCTACGALNSLGDSES